MSEKIKVPGTVLLGRHGQTEWNKIGRWQGQLDSPLTPAGWASAEALAQLAAGPR